MSNTPPERYGPELPPKGINAMRQFLTSMARDVPAQLKRSAKYRNRLRRAK